MRSWLAWLGRTSDLKDEVFVAAITEQEIQLLKGAQSLVAWTDACAKIKRAHMGHYPTDWFARVLRSGLADEVLARFGHSTAIAVEKKDLHR
jgi:hypothetical protein